jgi:hypothetical protein
MTILFDSKDLRKVTTFALGLFPVEAPAPKTEPTAPAYDAPADDWGARFDAAQRRYRESLRKPAKVETPAPVACDECGDDECTGDDQEASTAAEWPAEADADRWTVGPDVYPDESPAPTPATPRRRASVPSPIDQAWDLGWKLGRDGREAGPSARMTDDEAAAFIAGWDQGAALYRDEELAAAEAYCRMLDQSADPLDDIHDGELNEARMIRPLYQEARAPVARGVSRSQGRPAPAIPTARFERHHP